MVELRYPRKDVGIYCLQISHSLFIDAALFRGAGASANASRKGIRANARFVVNPRTGSARLETSRPIQAGGEIFVSYGPEYWRGAHSSSHSTSLVPVWEWDCSDPFAQLRVARVPSSGALVGPVMLACALVPFSLMVLTGLFLFAIESVARMVLSDVPVSLSLCLCL